MRQILSLAEIERNRRVKELMQNKSSRPLSQPMKLSQQEMDEVNDLRKQGYSRDESVKIVLETKKLLKK